MLSVVDAAAERDAFRSPSSISPSSASGLPELVDFEMPLLRVVSVTVVRAGAGVLT